MKKEIKDMNKYQGQVEVATGAFIIKDNKVLLCTGPKFHGEFVPPGGHVEFGETIQQCIEREALEETGLTVKTRGSPFIIENTKRKIAGYERHFIFINYECEIIKGEIKLQEKEFTQYEWFDLQKATADPRVTQSARDSIKVILSRK